MSGSSGQHRAASATAARTAAWAIAGVILLFFSVGYSAMSRHITNAGAFYAYIANGLGRPVGIGGA